MGSEIWKPDDLKSVQRASLLSKTIWNGTLAIAIAKVQPFENRTIWKLKLDPQKVQISNISRFQMVRFQILTVFRSRLYLWFLGRLLRSYRFWGLHQRPQTGSSRVPGHDNRIRVQVRMPATVCMVAWTLVSFVTNQNTQFSYVHSHIKRYIDGSRAVCRIGLDYSTNLSK